MSDREVILQQALALPPDDRAYVATALEHSLAGEGDPMSSQEFLAELQRRSAAYQRRHDERAACSGSSSRFKRASSRRDDDLNLRTDPPTT